VEGTRNHKRKEAYAALVQQPYTNSTIYAAFMTGTKHIYRDELPPPPNHWQELKNHPHQAGFKAAVQKEYKEIKAQGTFTIKPRPLGQQIIPLK
jgi:hypothetical protein